MRGARGGSVKVPKDNGGQEKRKPSPSLKGKRIDEHVSLRVTHTE